MTDTDTLRAAAQKILDLADAAQDDLDTGDYWASYPKQSAWHDGLTNGMGGTSGDLAAAFSPAVARALADWLRDSATLHLPVSECGYCDPSRNPLRLPCRALAVAWQILGGDPA